MVKAKGAVAAGHEETARAAEIILEEGGNAFDAALGALCATAVTEPVLGGFGGGGFLLARPGVDAPVLYDFFAQTPKCKRPEDQVDFKPILADFGSTTQEFHIGMGAMATPGIVAGLFRVHKDLGYMPLSKIVEPALALAKSGTPLHRLQAYIFTIVNPIYTSTKAALDQYGSLNEPGRLLQENENLAIPDYAETLDCLVNEGEGLFYRGEICQRLVADSAQLGGYLTQADMSDYQVVLREPLELNYGGARLFTNPPPSTGGILIAFALEIMKGVAKDGLTFGSQAHVETLARVMDQTNKARIDSGLAEEGEAALRLLDPKFFELYKAQVQGRPTSTRGTTHISVVDVKGNAASLTLSNGEGCGYIIPGTGIMMNNMLGEEDINPRGFHQWATDTRMASMMAPTLMFTQKGEEIVMGSGGSNRIRTAILQVLTNLLDYGMSLDDAVGSPRVHYEGGCLNLEKGYSETLVEALSDEFPEAKLWQEKNLFFGGVHSVAFDPEKGIFHGSGDPRRGGVAKVV